MAIVSSHALDAVRGHHAAGLKVRLQRLDPGAPVTLFDTATDDGGRLVQQVELDPRHRDAQYELSFGVGEFVAAHSAGTVSPLLQATVLRFAMPDAAARYHFPLSITPASCSVLAVVQPG